MDDWSTREETLKKYGGHLHPAVNWKKVYDDHDDDIRIIFFFQMQLRKYCFNYKEIVINPIILCSMRKGVWNKECNVWKELIKV